MDFDKTMSFKVERDSSLERNYEKSLWSISRERI